MAVACFSLHRRTSGSGSCTSAGLHPTPQCYCAPPPYFRGSPEGCFKRTATISGGGRETLAASLCCVNWPRRLRVLLMIECDSFDAMKKWIVSNGSGVLFRVLNHKSQCNNLFKRLAHQIVHFPSTSHCVCHRHSAKWFNSLKKCLGTTQHKKTPRNEHLHYYHQFPVEEKSTSVIPVFRISGRIQCIINICLVYTIYSDKPKTAQFSGTHTHTHILCLLLHTHIHSNNVTANISYLQKFMYKV